MSCNRLCSASCVCVDRSVELSGSSAADRAASAMAQWPRMLQKRSSCVLFGSLSRRPCLTRRSSDACGCAGVAPTAACARVTLSVCKVQPLLTHIQQLHDAEGRDERGLNSPCLMRRGHRLQRFAAPALEGSAAEGSGNPTESANRSTETWPRKPSRINTGPALPDEASPGSITAIPERSGPSLCASSSC